MLETSLIMISITLREIREIDWLITSHIITIYWASASPLFKIIMLRHKYWATPPGGAQYLRRSIIILNNGRAGAQINGLVLPLYHFFLID